jgi:hypothetical protein
MPPICLGFLGLPGEFFVEFKIHERGVVWLEDMMNKQPLKYQDPSKIARYLSMDGILGREPMTLRPYSNSVAEIPIAPVICVDFRAFYG